MIRFLFLPMGTNLLFVFVFVFFCFLLFFLLRFCAKIQKKRKQNKSCVTTHPSFVCNYMRNCNICKLLLHFLFVQDCPFAMVQISFQKWCLLFALAFDFGHFEKVITQCKICMRLPRILLTNMHWLFVWKHANNNRLFYVSLQKIINLISFLLRAFGCAPIWVENPHLSCK